MAGRHNSDEGLFMEEPKKKKRDKVEENPLGLRKKSRAQETPVTNSNKPLAVRFDSCSPSEHVSEGDSHED